MSNTECPECDETVPIEDLCCGQCVKNRIGELERLVIWYRQAMAYEARVAEAHYEALKSYPKSRRLYAEAQVERMRKAATTPFTGYVGIGRDSFESEFRALTKECT